MISISINSTEYFRYKIDEGIMNIFIGSTLLKETILVREWFYLNCKYDLKNFSTSNLSILVKKNMLGFLQIYLLIDYIKLYIKRFSITFTCDI